MTGRLFTTILALAVSVRALAAGYDDFADLGRKPHRRNIRTEWGITAGAHYTGIRLFGQEASMKASPRLGYEAGVHMALRFGDWLALQPEIYYSHTTIDMQADGVDGKIRVKSHAVEFPVLLSLRVLDPVRINAGPVITLMNNSSYIAPDGEDHVRKHQADVLLYGRSLGLHSAAPARGRSIHGTVQHHAEQLRKSRFPVEIIYRIA